MNYKKRTNRLIFIVRCVMLCTCLASITYVQFIVDDMVASILLNLATLSILLFNILSEV